MPRRSVALLGAFVLTFATAATFLWLAATVRVPPVAAGDSAPAVGVVRAFYAAANADLRTGDVSALERVVAPDLLDHALPQGLASTRAGLEDDLRALRATYPGLQLQPGPVSGHDGLVAAGVRVAAGGRGAFLGLPLPAPATAWAGSDFFRIAGDQVVERWGEPDGQALFQPWQQTALDLPLAPRQVVSWQRVALAPGASTSGFALLGPEVLYVTGGAPTVAVDASSAVTTLRTPGAAAGAVASPQALPRGRATTLAPGDLLLLPLYVPYTLRNPGIAPAAFLALGSQLVPEDTGAAALPFLEGAGITVQNLVGASTDVPVGPAVAALGQATLPPGAAIPAHRATGPELFAVESGSLTLAVTARQASVRRAADGAVELVRPPAGPATLGAGDGALVAAGAVASLRNDGAEPVTLLVATLRPDGAAGPTTPGTLAPSSTSTAGQAHVGGTGKTSVADACWGHAEIAPSCPFPVTASGPSTPDAGATPSPAWPTARPTATST